MPSVYGIGNPLIDILCRSDDSILRKLDLTKGTMLLLDEKKREKILSLIENLDVTYSCGGSCPNTMVTLSTLGLSSAIAGGVGKDKEGKMYEERLNERGVYNFLSSFDSPTGTSIIFLSPEGERTMNTYLGANQLFDEDNVDIETVRGADLFYFTGYMWDTEKQQRSVRKVLKYAKEHKIKIAFDLADPFAVARYRKVFFTLLEEYCDIVFANQEEARFLVENYDAYECCRSIGKIVPITVVKTGKSGSFVSDDRKIYSIPLVGSTRPLDTTGAGDTYAAGFLYGYLQGWDARKAGISASFLAGEITTILGAQFPLEKKGDLLNGIEKAISLYY